MLSKRFGVLIPPHLQILVLAGAPPAVLMMKEEVVSTISPEN
jgi:hypothetical protein